MNVAELEKTHVLRVKSKALRRLGQNEVLVKVDACGVCGTDLHIVEGKSRSTPPVVLGHEYAGIVEDCGSGAAGFQNGDHVGVDPNISCGVCFYCRRGLVHLCTNLRALGVDIDGGMAQFSIVPVNQLYRLPSGMSPERSAFVEPVSCAIHGIDKAGIKAGDTVLILGGGTIGLVMLQLARHAGAATTIVVEPIEHKCDIARQLGADFLLNPRVDDVHAAVMDLTGVGADVSIECAGTPGTMRQSINLTRRGGTVEFFGVCPIGETIPVEPNQVYFKELTIVGSYVNPHTFSRSIAVLESGIVRVEPLKPDSFPLEGVHEALSWLHGGKTLKSIIRPNQ